MEASTSRIASTSGPGSQTLSNRVVGCFYTSNLTSAEMVGTGCFQDVIPGGRGDGPGDNASVGLTYSDWSYTWAFVQYRQEMHVVQARCA